MDFSEREANGTPLQCVLAVEAKSPISASITEAYNETVPSAPKILQCHRIIDYVPGATTP